MISKAVHINLVNLNLNNSDPEIAKDNLLLALSTDYGVSFTSVLYKKRLNYKYVRLSSIPDLT